MKKASLSVLVSLSMLAGAAYAQTEGSVNMSTDPAKAAEIEQRAQALQAQQEMQPQMPAKEHMPMHHGKAMKHKKKSAAAPTAASE
ncbi:hypothetical protein LJR230_002285 [Trinickia sp. LjRoot230]|uniref:hypothetical protein n=1 Tax=Trinickia sp. LjRoot230 TaxID=3342288 RepID=UPI003ED04A3E